MKAFTEYIGKQWLGGNFIFAVSAVLSSEWCWLRRGRRCAPALLAGSLLATACSAPDPHEPRGAMAAAAEAIEKGDGRSLFRLIDQRSRHALAAIRDARTEAYQLVQADYPDAEKPAALAALGDAAVARDAADLFVKRCPQSCQATLGQSLAAPTAEHPTPNGDLEIETAAGTRVVLHRGKDGLYGLAFRNAELSTERDRASRELLQIRQNAEIYRRRRSLEPGTNTLSGSATTTPSRK